MSSHYGKYLLDKDPDYLYQKSNILKSDYTINYNDYEKLKINEQFNKLYSNTYNKNIENIENKENKKIYNLSLLELYKKSGDVYLNLINDLSIYFDKNNSKTINQLGLILTKEDNLLYIGLLFLVLSFFIWLINITS